MAQFKMHKDSWPADTTQSQKTMALEFLKLLLQCATTASKHYGLGDFSEGGAHGAKAEQRFYQTGGHRFYRASIGSTIERTVYQYLEHVLCPTEVMDRVYRFDGWGNLDGSIYALEFTSSLTELPHKFGSSRPDIRLALGQGTTGKYYEAIYDLTSLKQTGHVLKKGDNWLAKGAVPLIAEIIWLDDDIMHQ